jgi:uncharacterized protein with PCYCGC motif
MIAGAAVLAVAGVFLFTGRSEAGHPDARPGITATLVLPTIAVPRTNGSAEAYGAARAVPQVLDGLYCHCQCKEHSGHRSLLTCFESEHGAYCDICMNEAVTAAHLTGQGATLEQIRKAIDEDYVRQ